MSKVWVIDLPVHVVADTAELARDHLATVADKGAVMLECVESADTVTVLHVNYPEDRGYDGQNPYDLDESGEVVPR